MLIGIIARLGTCESCDWQEDLIGSTTHLEAKAHTKKTGHITTIEVTRSYKYTPQVKK